MTTATFSRAVAIAAAAAAIAGCGGGEADDTTSDAGGGNAAAAGGPGEGALRFARCMREHGVDFPDPEISENGTVRMRPGENVDPQDPKVQEAQRACEHHQSEGAENVPPEQQEERREAMLRFAECMRENGVENFPDPTGGGGIRITPQDGVNPDDPAFQRAMEQCQDDLPRQGGATP